MYKSNKMQYQIRVSRVPKTLGERSHVMNRGA